MHPPFFESKRVFDIFFMRPQSDRMDVFQMEMRNSLNRLFEILFFKRAALGDGHESALGEDDGDHALVEFRCWDGLFSIVAGERVVLWIEFQSAVLSERLLKGAEIIGCDCECIDKDAGLVGDFINWGKAYGFSVLNKSDVVAELFNVVQVVRADDNGLLGPALSNEGAHARSFARIKAVERFI